MSVESVELVSDDASASVALCGAELQSWRVGGVPLLWEPETEVWADTAPILFPVVGWTRDARINVEGQVYPLGLHGFARHLDFTVREQWPGHVRLVATATAETRALYPFEWDLEVEHALAGPALTTRLRVRNAGAVPMPYACGLHPGFRWPFAGGKQSDYVITFAERETTNVPVISSDGLFTPQTRTVPLDGRRLALSPELMAREALCFLDVRSRSLRFGHAASGPRSTSHWKTSRMSHCGRDHPVASSASRRGPDMETPSMLRETFTLNRRCACSRRVRWRAMLQRSPSCRRTPAS